MDPVKNYLDGLDPGVRERIDALRSIVGAVGSDLTETIKWNAPNFAVAGEDRITLGVERNGGVRLVLHLGARAQTPEGFAFPDPDGLARWPTADRGVATFATLSAIRDQEGALRSLCERWLNATRSDRSSGSASAWQTGRP